MSKVATSTTSQKSGSSRRVELVEAEDNALGVSAVDAMRAASPFPPMPEAVRCLAGRAILGRFRTKAQTSDDAGGLQENAGES